MTMMPVKGLPAMAGVTRSFWARRPLSVGNGVLPSEVSWAIFAARSSTSQGVQSAQRSTAQHSDTANEAAIPPAPAPWEITRSPFWLEYPVAYYTLPVKEIVRRKSVSEVRQTQVYIRQLLTELSASVAGYQAEPGVACITLALEKVLMAMKLETPESRLLDHGLASDKLQRVRKLRGDIIALATLLMSTKLDISIMAPLPPEKIFQSDSGMRGPSTHSVKHMRPKVLSSTLANELGMVPSMRMLYVTPCSLPDNHRVALIDSTLAQWSCSQSASPTFRHPIYLSETGDVFWSLRDALWQERTFIKGRHGAGNVRHTAPQAAHVNQNAVMATNCGFLSPYWVQLDTLKERWGVSAAHDASLLTVEVGGLKYINADQTSDASVFNSLSCCPYENKHKLLTLHKEFSLSLDISRQLACLAVEGAAAMARNHMQRCRHEDGATVEPTTAGVAILRQLKEEAEAASTSATVKSDISFADGTPGFQQLCDRLRCTKTFSNLWVGLDLVEILGVTLDTTCAIIVSIPLSLLGDSECAADAAHGIQWQEWLDERSKAGARAAGPGTLRASSLPPTSTSQDQKGIAGREEKNATFRMVNAQHIAEREVLVHILGYVMEVYLSLSQVGAPRSTACLSFDARDRKTPDDDTLSWINDGAASSPPCPGSEGSGVVPDRSSAENGIYVAFLYSYATALLVTALGIRCPRWIAVDLLNALNIPIRAEALEVRVSFKAAPIIPAGGERMPESVPKATLRYTGIIAVVNVESIGSDALEELRQHIPFLHSMPSRSLGLQRSPRYT